MTTLNLTEALDIFLPHLEEIKEALAANILDDMSKLEPVPVRSGYEGELWQDIKKLEIEAITEKRSRTIKRIVAKLEPPKRGRITTEDIERAREYPIKELHQQLHNTPIRGGMTKCPFHKDDTDSLSFRRYNRFRCFGCETRGDTITYYMKSEGKDFISAVKFLIN